MVEVRRRDYETTGAMLRRFTRRVQMSGILIRARKTKHYHSKPTRRAKRLQTLRRIRITKERERLEKLGKLEKEGKRT